MKSMLLSLVALLFTYTAVWSGTTAGVLPIPTESPSSPELLKIQIVHTHEVLLTWANYDRDVKTYLIEKSRDGQAYQPVQEINAQMGTEVYMVMDHAGADQRYFYRLLALDYEGHIIVLANEEVITEPIPLLTVPTPYFEALTQAKPQ